MTPSAPGVYAHSGKLGSALFLAPIGGLSAALVLGVVYAYVDVYSPIAGYVSILFVVGFAFALGWTISRIGYAARCRSPIFLAVTGVVAGLVGLYTSWAAFTYALLQRYGEDFEPSLLDVFLSPAGIWEIVQSINATGWYTIQSITPTGAVLGVLWGIEALIIVGGTAMWSMSALGGEVFCERCNRWTSKNIGKVRLALPEDQSKLQALSHENLQSLETLETVSPQENPHLRIDSWECGSCIDRPALQVNVHAFVQDKKGKIEEKVIEATPILSVTASVFEGVSKLADRPERPHPTSDDADAG